MSMFFIPLIIIGVSLLGILFILLRKVRTISGEKTDRLVYPEVESTESDAEFAAESANSPIAKLFKIGSEGAVVRFMEKFFRKMRVRLMRIENLLTNITNKLHERNLQSKGRKSSSGNEDSSGKEEGIISAEEIDKGKNKDNASEGNATLIVALNEPDEKFDEEYWINLLKHDHGNVYPYKKLGEIYYAREDFSEARSVLKYALKLDPSDEETRARLNELKGKRTRRKIQNA